MMFWLIQALLIALKYTLAPGMPWWAVLLPTIIAGAMLAVVAVFAVLLATVGR